MMGPFEPSLPLLLIDLVILCGATALIVFAFSGRRDVPTPYPRRGVSLFVTGLVLLAFAYLTEVFISSGLAALWGLRTDAFPGAVTEWGYWVFTRGGIMTVLAGLILNAVIRRRLEAAYVESRSKVEDASQIAVQSETRFRHLSETTSNSIFCYKFDPPMPIDLPIEEQVQRSHDAILVECNKVFANVLNSEGPWQVVGSRMGDLEGNKDTEAHFRFFSAFIESDYRLKDYELVYKTPAGEERAVVSSLTGIVSDGLLHRFWGAESSILDLRQTRAALERRRRFQTAVAEVSSALVIAPSREAEDAVTACLSKVCRHIAADRMTIYWLDVEHDRADIAYSWGKSTDAILPTLSMKDFPSFVGQVLANEILQIDDVDALPEQLKPERELMQQMGIQSFAALPMFVADDIVGACTVTRREFKRAWSDEDIAEMHVFSDLFANYVYRLNARQALDKALASLQQATARLEAENVYLRHEIEVTHRFDEIIGQSDVLHDCLRLVVQVADTMTPVLVLGETGTGKELIARALHDHSSRRDRPLVKVNCAALPANLIESELFGYEKGAFTGAEKRKRGRFDLANGSTMFLDEIADIPLELQAKLLRVLQEGEMERLGGTETIEVDVRIVAATNRDLAKAVRDGEFRSDLYYRINTFPIELPPLRTRGDDIQLLAEHFVNVHSQHLGRDVNAISANMMRRLRDYSWPGNVRELEGVIQRALISSTGPVLELPDQAGPTKSFPDDDEPRVLSSSIANLHMVEREHIVSILEDANWKISGQEGAAAKLGIPPSTLRSKMKRLAIVRPH